MSSSISRSAGLDYVVGDSFGIYPTNDPALADAVLAALGAPADFPIGGRTLREVLIDGVSLSPAPDMLFQLISYITGGERRQKAKALASGEDPDGDAATLDVLAAIEKFRGIRPDPEAFVEVARSAAAAALFDLVVAEGRARAASRPPSTRCATASAGAQRLGVASTFLAERIGPGDRSRSTCRRRRHFGLPADPRVPIIMIGPGTGIAPFRAFLHERMATKAPGRNWLFFGHQRRDYDFFYEDELAGMKAQGVLTRLTLAWSRDGDQKIYVQDRMREVGRDLWAWLADGAHVYVCGDAKRMAKDVERALVDVVAQYGARSADEAIAFVADAQEERPLPAGRLLRPAMNALPPHARPCARPAPIAASVAACWRGRTGAAAPTISGDPDHPANIGRLCSKGSALGETLGLEGRLLHPMLRQPMARSPASTGITALDCVADGFRRIVARHGPDAVAFYLSGQLLTEDYYVANKLMKGFLGSANVDTNSRLCMASIVAGHRRAFGADVVPGTYEDLDQADLIVLVGSNAAWCHPVLYPAHGAQPATSAARRSS